MAAGTVFRRVKGRIIPIAKKAGEAAKKAKKKNIFAKEKQARRVRKKLIGRDIKVANNSRVTDIFSPNAAFEMSTKNLRARSVVRKTERRAARAGIGAIAGTLALGQGILIGNAVKETKKSKKKKNKQGF